MPKSKDPLFCPLMSNPSGLMACQPGCKFYRPGSTNFECILMELHPISYAVRHPESISARVPKVLQNPPGVIEVKPPSYKPLPKY